MFHLRTGLPFDNHLNVVELKSRAYDDVIFLLQSEEQ